MKLPNWFRIVWWALLAGGLGLFLKSRLVSLRTGSTSTFDVVALVLFAALLLLPLVSELELFGVLKLKQQLDSLRSHVDREVTSLRSEIRNVIGVTSQVSPQFHFGSLPPDSQLPQLQETIRTTVHAVLHAQGARVSPSEASDLAIERIDDDVAYLFAARYELESALHRVYNRATAGYVRPSRSAMQQAELLRLSEVIDSRLFDAIREVYAVCSAGIHGLPVTPARLEFVRETAPGLVQALKALANTSNG